MKTVLAIRRAAGLLLTATTALALESPSKQNTADVQPPVAKSESHITTTHGVERKDPYYWLRGKEKPEVIEHLEAENAYALSKMAHTQMLQDTLYNEMKGRIQETDLSVPVFDGGWYYYTRTEEGKQYSVNCRKKGALDAEEEILLDQNELAKGHEYFRVGVFDVSPNGSLLAYSVDTEGDEIYTMYFKDLSTGELLDDKIAEVSYASAWANDNKTLFYTTMDATRRPYRVHRHILGDSSDKDALIFEDKDERFFVGVDRSRSDQYLFITAGSTESDERWYMRADTPTAEFKLIQPRTAKLEYSVEHHGDVFLITTNADGATNFKLMQTPVDKPGKENWEEFIRYNPEVYTTGVDAFKDYLVVYERADGLRQLHVFDIKSGIHQRLEFDEPTYAVFPNANPEYDTTKFRYGYTSLTTPMSVYERDLKTDETTLLKQTPVLGGYDAKNYESRREYATARDGTLIPMSIVYRKGLTRDGDNPTLLYGYGSYGASSEPYFSSNRVSLLDRGFVFATAHIRGGGEMGRTWYESGKYLHKMNTFTDFVDCAQHLIEQDYTNPKKLAINGGSAGGLLVGAAANLRPDLFEVVIANVPFVDVMNTMLDATLPLTVTEYEEWGNPNEKEYFEYMLSYSPYDNVKATRYPHMLVTAGLNDPRVSYWEPAKWVAKLRAMKTDDNIILLKTNMGAGHGGASGRYDKLKETAFEYAFLIDRLGEKESEAGSAAR
ncbi:MAG: S9 family peptidase [Phycisphaerae bacterium]